MKLTLALFVLLGLLSSSLASYSVKKPHPFIIDVQALKAKHDTKKASFAELPAFIEQNFRDSSRITEFLKGLRERLAKERTEQLAILEQQKTQCRAEETFRNEAISAGTDAAARSQSQLNLCVSEREEATSLRDLASNALVVYKNELASLEQARVNQIDLYKNRRQRLSDVQAAIESTVEFMDRLEAEAGGLIAPAFVQLTNKLLKSSVKTGHSHLVLPVYTKLLQMHANKEFDSGDLDEVRNLLDQLRENAANSIQELDEQEAADLEDYNSQHKRLDDLISKLENQVSVSNAYIESMNACALQETSIMDLANDKVTRNQGLLDMARELCALSEQEFNQGEIVRTRQTNIINALEVAVGRIVKQHEQDVAPKVGDLINLRLL